MDNPTIQSIGEKAMEPMLNSFADMLQNEMHQLFSQIDNKLDGLAKLQCQIGQQSGQTVKQTADRLAEGFAGVIEQQGTTIQKQHQALSKYQEDLLYKIQKSLILELVDISDNIRMILQDQKKEKDYDALLNAIQGLEEWVEASLSNHSVKQYREADDSPGILNRKRQEVVGTETTEDPEKDNTYMTDRPGYVWTMPYLVVNSDVQLQKILDENRQPQTFSFVIRPEEVVKLKYKNINETNNTTKA